MKLSEIIMKNSLKQINSFNIMVQDVFEQTVIVEPVKPTIDSLRVELNILKRKIQEVENKIDEMDL